MVDEGVADDVSSIFALRQGRGCRSVRCPEGRSHHGSSRSLSDGDP